MTAEEKRLYQQEYYLRHKEGYLEKRKNETAEERRARLDREKENQAACRVRNRERILENGRRYYQRHRDKIRAAGKKRRVAAVAAGYSDTFGGTMYNLTKVEYETLLKDQKNFCAICSRPETMIARNGLVRRLCIDHDRESGLVRGLLCNACNRAGGLYEHDPERLELAACYFRAAQKRVAENRNPALQTHKEAPG